MSKRRTRKSVQRRGILATRSPVKFKNGKVIKSPKRIFK
jgi:hypothetical protein